MFLLGRKLKMSQTWQDKKVVPVTVIKVEPNKVSLVRTKDRDGYEAVQVVVGRTKREFRTDGTAHSENKIKANDVINVSIFEENDIVDIRGVSKGKGFQGVVKRHGFSGGPKTHGQKNRHRAPGSIGSTAAQRVVPGRRMAGRMGGDTITVKNLKIAGIDKENNIVLLRGAVPGIPGGLVEIRLRKRPPAAKKAESAPSDKKAKAKSK